MKLTKQRSFTDVKAHYPKGGVVILQRYGKTPEGLSAAVI